MLGISYEFFYPEDADDGAFCVVTVRQMNHSDDHIVIVTDVKGNSGRPIAECWSPSFVEAIFSRVDIARSHEHKGFGLEPMSLSNTTLVECVESKEDSSRSYFLVTISRTGQISRKLTTVEQLEEETGDYWGDDFEDAAHYK